MSQYMSDMIPVLPDQEEATPKDGDTALAAEINNRAAGIAPTAMRPPTRPNCRCWTNVKMLPEGTLVVVWQTAMDDRVSTRPLATPWGVVAGDRALQGVIVSEGPHLGRSFESVAAEMRT